MVSRTRDDDATASSDAGEGRVNFQVMFNSGRSFSGHERNCAFLNTTGAAGAAGFADISAVSGFDFPDDGRAIALTDWDHDGDVDVWVSNRNAPRVRFLRNDHPQEHGWIAIRLEGNGTTVSRDAIGTRVTLGEPSASHPQTKTLRAGEGFLAQSSKWLTFGLADRDLVEQVAVEWPDGTSQSFTNLVARHRYRLRQGSPEAALEDGRRDNVRLEPSTPGALPPANSAGIASVALLQLPGLTYNATPRSGPRRITPGAGRSLLINLWSASCLPCLKELREFQHRFADLQVAKIDVVAVSVDAVRGDRQEIDAAQERIAEFQLPFTVGYADRKLIRTFQALHNSLVPSTRLIPVPSSILIDQQGQLAVFYKGPVSVDQVLADVGHTASTAEERYARMFPFGGHAIPHPRTAEMIARSEEQAIFNFAEELDSAYRTKSAMALYQQLVDRFPENAFARFALGRILAGEVRLPEARLQFLEALRLDPSYFDAHLRLGVVLLLMERPHEAVRHLEQAVALRPTNARARVTLGATLEKLGRSTEALQQFEAVLEHHPDDPRAQDAVQRLSQPL
ncbi:MAG: tetratricopeptide repeat protein [Planctomycetota bacterium]|nr:MAG: tetratricopeptide repeat protein [Planctomycetota bacterium]REK47893.1 MAG: tetratricopeptide repeat protein [Planctomycetota bacterium]